MDEPSLSAWADELDSKDTKRRLQALEALGSALELRPWSQPPSAAQEELARIYDDNSWQRLVAPLVCTLRDNNFKVCRASLACLESLVARVTESDAHSGRIGGGGGGGRNGSGSSSSGNANSIVPFLSLITPAVVDCLGNSKAAVQEKGVSVLLAISDPLVAGAHDTISSVQQHFGRHRNWRVRERLVAYLGRAAELDSAGVNRVQQQRAAAAVGKESSLLAQLLGDALNDSASQVRQEALAAAERVVEVLRGDGGPVLLVSGGLVWFGLDWIFVGVWVFLLSLGGACSYVISALLSTGKADWKQACFVDEGRVRAVDVRFALSYSRRRGAIAGFAWQPSGSRGSSLVRASLRVV